jgi:hypothetical protein
LWLQWSSEILFLTIWGPSRIIPWREVLRSPFPQWRCISPPPCRWPWGIGWPVLLDEKVIPGLNSLSNAGRKGLSNHHSNQAILCTDQGR